MQKQWRNTCQRFGEAARLTDTENEELLRVPRTLLKWLEEPVVTRLLGYAMLEEIEETHPVLPREPEDRAEVARLRWRRLEVCSYLLFNEVSSLILLDLYRILSTSFEIRDSGFPFFE